MKRSPIAILILEDEPAVRDSFGTMLTDAARRAGVDVIIDKAASALEALQACRLRRFDAIILDYLLRGGLNGDEFLDLLEEPPTLIIMVSGVPEEELSSVVTARHQTMGARFRFLKKPISKLTMESCFLNIVDEVRPEERARVLVVAPKPAEWEVWFSRLRDRNEVKRGKVVIGKIGDTEVVVALTGKGQTTTAAAVGPLVTKWQPTFVLLVGIAGGIGSAKKGHVVVSSFVYALDYGKIEDGRFRLRPELDWVPDKRLLDAATNLVERSEQRWIGGISATIGTEVGKHTTKAHVGYFGSLDKLVDDLEYPLVEDALRIAPEIVGIEMEAIGANAAIREVRANGTLKSPAGLIMIRGISDEVFSSARKTGAGMKSRTRWTKFAAEAAASFAVALIDDVCSTTAAAREEQSRSC